MDDRAVTEVVGFILVFSIVLGTITFVYVGGLGGLQDTRDSERTANAERAFDVLANNFQDVARGNAPSRATEIKLAEAGLRVDDNGRFEINASSMDSSAVARPRPVVYSAGDRTQIVYESGAVIREDGDAAIMLRDPDFVFDDERTVVRYVEPRGGSASVSGSTTVLVRSERSHSRLLASESDPGTVNLSFRTSPTRAGVWKSYFEGELAGMSPDCHVTEDGSGDSATVYCDFDTDHLMVARSRLWVELV